jgi:hypothetical protein
VRIDLEFDPSSLLFRPVVATAEAPRGRPSEQQVLAVLQGNAGSTIDQLAGSLSTSDTTLRPIVASLVQSRKVSALPAAHGRGKIYRLAA